MRLSIRRFTTAALTIAAAFAVTHAHALEQTAGSGNGQQVDLNNINIKLDNSTQALTAALNQVNGLLSKVMICNAKRMVYAPADTAKDADGCVDPGFDPNRLTYSTSSYSGISAQCMPSKGYPCRSDAITANHFCEGVGANGYTAYNTGSYRSPGNNHIAFWNPSSNSYNTYNAKQNNNFISSITCYRFGVKDK